MQPVNLFSCSIFAQRGWLFMLVLRLIFPAVLYSVLSGVIAETTSFSAVVCTMLAAAVTFPLLYWSFFRHDQTVRGQLPPIPFRFGGCLLLILLLGIGICVSVNNMISLTPLPAMSEAFEATSEVLYSPPVFMQLFALAVVIPAAEEMIFRGLMFAPLRDRFSFWPSAVASSLLFGLYHGNLVQLVYAFALGMVMAWLYEKFSTLAAPYLFHASANFFSILATNYAVGEMTRPENTVLFAAATALSAALSVFCFIRIERKLTIKEEKV